MSPPGAGECVADGTGKAAVPDGADRHTHLHRRPVGAGVRQQAVRLPPSDIDAGVPPDELGSHFAMRDYHVLSMDRIGGLVTDHGVEFTLDDVPGAGRPADVADRLVCQTGSVRIASLELRTNRAGDHHQPEAGCAEAHRSRCRPECEIANGRWQSEGFFRVNLPLIPSRRSRADDHQPDRSPVCAPGERQGARRQYGGARADRTPSDAADIQGM